MSVSPARNTPAERSEPSGETPRGATTPVSLALALVPVLGLTLGIPFANHVEPRIFGLPFLPVYIVGWIVVTPAFMFAVYRSEGRA